MKRGALLIALLIALPLGCAPDAAPPPWIPAASSSLALTADGLWVASPDDDRLVLVDPDTLAVVRHVELAGGPVGVTVVGDRLAVALSRGTEAAFVDPDGAVERAPLPCGGIGAVVALGDAALFACPHDDRLVEVGADGRLRVMHAPGRPTALAVRPDALVVTAARAGAIRTLDRAAYERGSATWQSRALVETPGFAATRVDALAPAGGAVFASYQRVDHDSARDRPPSEGTYGRVVDDTPRIEPQIDGCGPRYARFDGGARVFSGPSALARSPATGHLWVAHQFTDNVAVLDCAGPPRLIATAPTGRGPRGIALSPDGRTAWIDAAFDHAITRVTLPADGPPTEITRARPTGPLHLSPAAERGRRLFHDAVDTHLTPSGVVACASCHPDGGEDGLAWFLHTPTVARKLRRTPPAYGARRALSPYHFDGEFADAAALTRATIRGLMDGDALLVDLDAIAAYLDERPAPPGRPAFDADDTAAIARGAETFASAGCAECHPAPLYSDARAYTVAVPSADPDARLDVVDTPSLIAVRARPPYLHDGRAPTLADAVRAHDATPALDAAALADLVRYLETL